MPVTGSSLGLYKNDIKSRQLFDSGRESDYLKTKIISVALRYQAAVPYNVCLQDTRPAYAAQQPYSADR